MVIEANEIVQVPPLGIDERGDPGAADGVEFLAKFAVVIMQGLLGREREIDGDGLAVRVEGGRVGEPLVIFEERVEAGEGGDGFLPSPGILDGGGGFGEEGIAGATPRQTGPG